MARKNAPLRICDTQIAPGESITLAFPTPELYTCVPMHIPIQVIHGKREGPCLLVCAAFHGDEVNGIGIIQNLLQMSSLKSLCGTLIAIPVVNVYGLITRSRNLPDQRDLDKNFPGSSSGSFAARLAYMLSKEIFSLATHFIDIRTGEPHYNKLPQIHTDTDHEEALGMANAFKPPVIIHINDSKKGLLGKITSENSKNILVYEAGEALRLDKDVIRVGINGIVKVMRYLNMIKKPIKPKGPYSPSIVRSITWIRSPGSGLSKILKKPGSYVKKNDLLAIVSDPFGTRQVYNVTSDKEGILICNNSFPLINEGDPLLQIACFEEKPEDASQIQQWKTPPEIHSEV